MQDPALGHLSPEALWVSNAQSHPGACLLPGRQRLREAESTPLTLLQTLKAGAQWRLRGAAAWHVFCAQRMRPGNVTSLPTCPSPGGRASEPQTA